MNWIYYLVIFAALFVVITAILTIRHFLSEHIEELEEIEEKEEDARTTAESNSGL